ncbi:MAG TPA: cold shock domain-containing protein [Fibrella sp.]|jgi:cold shock CspA family protein
METFSKKEKEKARQKKRKDKEEKREERKATAQKGLGLDEMMAYVDENGNITSTPPDPTKKRRVIDQADIQIGVSKQEDAAPEDLVRKGIVTFFNSSKGYGFIRDQQSQESIFVHMNGLVDAITEQDKVTFEITKTPKGPNAVEVRKQVS